MKQSENWKLKIMRAMGVLHLIEDHIIFKPPNPSYILKNTNKHIEFHSLGEKKKYQNNLAENLRHKVYIIKDYENCELVSHVPLIKITGGFDKVVIFSHGNASDLGTVLDYGYYIAKLYSVDVICYDYSGYGFSKSRMKPSEQTLYRDLTNVLVFAHQYYQKIILWGFSLGSGPTVEIASKHKVSAVILQAPLSSVYRVINKSFQSSRDLFDNAKKIKLIDCPIFIMHGTSDQIIGIQHSEILVQNGRNVTFVKIDGATHNNLSSYVSSTYNPAWEGLTKFFTQDFCKAELNNTLNEISLNILIEDKLKCQSYDSLLQKSEHSYRSSGSISPQKNLMCTKQ